MTLVAVEVDELELIRALRGGDEAAFNALVSSYHASLVRLAATYVRGREAAEEVAQETWVAVLRRIDGFRGESALRTWIFRILTNIAKTRAVRDRRLVPLSSLTPEPSVDPERFFDAEARWAGHWSDAPVTWSSQPEERLESKELLTCVAEAIAELPDMQRQVMTLRDVEGWSADDVCGLLGLSEGNQRVLLHRARSKVRARLERLVTT